MKVIDSVGPQGQLNGWMVFCPACECGHMFTQGWAFNGDRDRPTFTPSMLVRSGHHVPGHRGPCWCTYNAEHPGDSAPFTCGVCHSFVRDGRIEFLGDCTHALRGQTVDLPDWDSETTA